MIPMGWGRGLVNPLCHHSIGTRETTMKMKMTKRGRRQEEARLEARLEEDEDGEFDRAMDGALRENTTLNTPWGGAGVGRGGAGRAAARWGSGLGALDLLRPTRVSFDRRLAKFARVGWAGVGVGSCGGPVQNLLNVGQSLHV